MQISDDIYLGKAFSGGNPAGMQSGNEPAPMELGIGPAGRIFIYDIAPVTSGAALLGALQTLAGAGSLVLTAGAGVTKTTGPDGVFRYNLDVPRCVTLTSTGVLNGINFTISGYDAYGKPMSCLIAGPNNNTVATTKAFASITAVAASAAVGTNISVGFNDKLGLLVFLASGAYVIQASWNTSSSKDGGTLVAGDTTSPATQATTDVRGCYTPSTAADGTKRLVMSIALSSAQCGPNASTVAAFGQPQV